jgi:NAD(P)-dependent dehydrogenase (short-subunit alcohol dehydrogenase family)
MAASLMYNVVMTLFRISYSRKPEELPLFAIDPGNYIVTGATGTIGSSICKHLAANPSVTVYAGTKNRDKFDCSAISKLSNVKPLILGDRDLVRSKNFFTPNLEIKGVIHCEGSYGVFGNLASVDADQWMDEINVYLKRLISLINWMSSGTQTSQIASIFLGGGGASEGYQGLSNYSVMKTSLVRMIEIASLEIPSEKLILNVLGPGPTNSQMVDQVINSSTKIDRRILDASISLRSSNKVVSDKVFRAINYLFSEEGREISGRFLSAEWDQINDLRIKDENSYKLRRVFPRE